MDDTQLAAAIRLAGVGQLGILVASSLVPSQLGWTKEFAGLPKLLRQINWIYGGYIVLGIFSNGLVSLLYADELARGIGVARAVCVYIFVFWGVRLCLQPLLDVKPYLRAWWLTAGYHLTTMLFTSFTIIFGYAAWH